MPDLKAVNADDFEQQLREHAQRATQLLASLAERAIADMRTVAAAQAQLQPRRASDLVLESRVALVQDLTFDPTFGQLRDLEFKARLRFEHNERNGEIVSGRLDVPPGKYRLLVFLVDQADAAAAPPAAICSCALSATVHAKTAQCPVVFAGLEDDDE